MSYGILCLKCRRYIAPVKSEPHKDHCKCVEPVPSEDGKTPLHGKEAT